MYRNFKLVELQEMLLAKFCNQMHILDSTDTKIFKTADMSVKELLWSAAFVTKTLHIFL